ncbi:hypothetical protein ACQ4PT_002834 [Festuca glaucescens]
MWSVRLSSIRPACRHASQLTAVLGSTNLIGSRGYASNYSGDRHAEVKRHLYVVLDDHEDGFGVHKLDLHDSDDDELARGAARRLPEPPALLVTLPTLGKHAQFSAVGTSIVAIGPTIMIPLLDGRWMPNDIGGVLVYDTKTAALTVVPHLPAGLMRGYKAAMAVGNNLYMLGTEPPWCHWDDGGSLHCLTDDPVGTGGETFWGWERMADSSPWCWRNFREPPVLPFVAKYITAHAVHRSAPGATEQQEILVSLRPTEKSRLGATFSFGTTSREWTKHGEWHLPIVGQACYDDHLNAWVGLHAVNGGNMYGSGSLVTDGHICVGNASSPSGWKVIKEKLFRLDEDVLAGWKHVDAMLVSMASGLRREEDEEETEQEEETEREEEEEEETELEDEEDEQCWGDGSKCLLRLASFRVEPGQDGEPMVRTRWPARSYEVSRHNRRFHAQAFWM